jgi:hypothetical protein
LKCSEEDFSLSISTLQETQDYQMSSNSVYRKGCKCPTVPPENFKYIHYNMLEDKLKSTANNLSHTVGEQVFYLKYGNNRDPGKSSRFSLKKLMVMAVTLTIKISFLFR